MWQGDPRCLKRSLSWIFRQSCYLHCTWDVTRLPPCFGLVQGKSSWKDQLRRFRIRFSCLLEDFERAYKWCWSLIEDLIRPINFRIRSLNQTNQFPTMKFVVRVRAFGQRLAAQGTSWIVTYPFQADPLCFGWCNGFACMRWLELNLGWCSSRYM